jgi:predicted PurR-regulated permease PerM
MKKLKTIELKMTELPSYIRFTMIALGIALVLLAMILGSVLFVPLVWAILLTMMVLPLAQWWERRVKFRALASVLTILMLAIAIGGILVLLASQAIGLAKDAPEIALKLTGSIEDLRHFVDSKLGIPFEEQPEKLKAQFADTAAGFLGAIGSTVQSTLTSFALMLVVPIYMFFLLTYRALFLNFVSEMTISREKTHIFHTLGDVSHTVQRYLRGVGIEVVIVAVMVLILFLILGIKHALFFAVLVALLNIIPYLGVMIGSSISVVYAFFTTDGLLTPILVFVFLWVIQIIDNNFVVPYVVGQQIKLNPLAVILVVVLGGIVWGVSGMILFIPILGMMKVIMDESVSLKPYGRLLGEGERVGPKKAG